MHMEYENKGLTLLANISAPAELQSVSGEFLFHTCSVIPAALPPKIAGTGFSKHTSLSSPHTGLRVCDAGSTVRAGPGKDLTCGLTCLLAFGSISGSCSQHDLRQVSVTCCDIMWSNLSFKLGCDSFLFLWGCITLKVLQ